MLSDTLFEVGCALAEELQDCDGYSPELIKDVLEGWMQLEKIRINLDRSPFQPELSTEEGIRLARLAISNYFKQGCFLETYLEKVL